MIITVAFDVKNHVEVLESWPIENGNVTFFLEREGDALKKVCLSFSGADIKLAPVLRPKTEQEHAKLTVQGGGYAALSRKMIMNWQAVLTGQQVVDIDFDSYELRFRAENVEEEKNIAVRSFKVGQGRDLQSACDFEKMGRAFCVAPISSDRIESTSHFREGRKAFEAGRFVDAYNNMFLFLETRYCDGKTKTTQQVNLLQSSAEFRAALSGAEEGFSYMAKVDRRKEINIFESNYDERRKIQKLVEIRGNLRHHFLKNSQRWDPNKQEAYEPAARFIGAVVGEIVIKESLDDIYSKDALAKFRDLSVSGGFETKVKVMTRRLERLPTLVLDMSFPTTVASSQLCLAALRNSIEACEKDLQIADTVRLNASIEATKLELFSVEMDVWAYSKERMIENLEQTGFIKCSFESYRFGNVVHYEFNMPFPSKRFTIRDAWNFLKFSFDHIERRDPTTRVLRLELSIASNDRPIAMYRVGAQVKN